MSITEDHDGELQVYELAYLVLPSIPEDNLPKVVTSLEKIIEKNGGKKIDAEDPFKHDLAYEMSKTVGASRYVVRDAYIGWIKFDLPAGKAGVESHPVEEIKGEVGKVAEILRSLIVKTERETKFTFAKMKAAREKVSSPVPETEEILETEPLTPEVIPEIIGDGTETELIGDVIQ